MDKIYINNKPVKLSEDFDNGLLTEIEWSNKDFNSHEKIAAELKNKSPYVVSVFIERLKWEFRHRKEYVKLTKIPIQSHYHELIFNSFYDAHGYKANDIYGDWLNKYNRNDDLIFKKEIEPKYKAIILSKYKNHDKLFKNRCEYRRERYYNLPDPLNRVDWRTLFDNIFIWTENGKKYARRGGGGSSGARETNSKFIYAMLDLNKNKPIPSYLMIYTEENKLKLAKKFESLTIPDYDIGSNYDIDSKTDKELKKNGHFIEWEDIFNPTHLIIK